MRILTSSRLLLALGLVMFLGCNKDNPIPEEQLTKTEILTHKTWQVDELHHVLSGVYSSYIRGGANTTGTKYDTLRFTFNTDGTGTHINENGQMLPMQWKFSTPDERNLQVTVGGLTYSWRMVEIAGHYLHATAAPLVIKGDNNNMEAFRLIQIP